MTKKGNFCMENVSFFGFSEFFEFFLRKIKKKKSSVYLFQKVTKKGNPEIKFPSLDFYLKNFS